MDRSNASSDNSIFLSIIIPVYNEESSLAKSLRCIKDFMASRYGYEIIVIDDGSSDKTISILQAIAAEKGNITVVINDSNTGKGYSVKRGVSIARGELCLVTDADLSVPIDETESLLKHIREGADIAIASRYLEGSQFLRPLFVKQIFGRIFNLLTRLLFGFKYRDTQCGFKLMVTARAKEIFSNSCINRFAFDVELLLLARKAGLEVHEVPVRCVNSRTSRVRLITDSLIMLKDVLLLRFRA